MSAHSRFHRYEEIAGLLRDSIDRGVYDPDGRLPSERSLVQTFDAQRKTVRQALALLEREGRIESVGKSGWFVAAGSPSNLVREIAGRRILLVTFRRRTTPSADTIAFGLRESLAEKGIQVLRFDSSSNHESQHIATVEQLTTVDAGGIVMWPHGPVDAKFLARLQASSPLILIDRRVFGFESDNVRFDDRGGARAVTEHLIQNGHRRIAFLGDEPFVETVQARWHGYRQALEDAEIEPDDRLTMMTFGSFEPMFTTSVKTLITEVPEPPTAIVCSNDGVASNLLLVLRKLGLRVPEDIAVTGFGNESPAYLDVMGLTSVNQSFSDLGTAAGNLLAERMSEPLSTRGNLYREIVLPMQLVPRASSNFIRS